MRNVGEESRKTYKEKFLSGFFLKYMSGNGLDIGYKGYLKDKVEPILPTALGIDLDYPAYNGIYLPFSSNSQDYVYNSHVLEHIENYHLVIRDWFRVIKPKGYLIIVVPHQWLYEKKATLPSRFNADHKRFYTAASLLREIEDSLNPNTFRIRHLRENDEGHDYDQPPEKHSNWLYEIECVIQKL
jgi:SAM-dependent methyltransferase